MSGDAEEPRAGRVLCSDLRERSTAVADDLEHVEERLDVVDDGRHPEEPDLHWKRRLVPRFAAKALDRLEERRLFAADVRARADAELDVEREPGSHDVVAEESTCTHFRERVLDPRVGERILGTDVDEAALATGRECCDRHRLDECKRILLHQHAVLERAGLGLVRVADEVVRLRGLLRDGFPLDAGRERRTAAAEETRRRHLADHALLPELERAPQCRVAAVRAVRVERLGIGYADATQQHEPGVAELRERRTRLRELDLTRLFARDRAQRRGRALAEAETGARVRTFRHLGAGQPAREVGADVQDVLRPLLEREQRVEARDAVRIRRRHFVAERALADPADAALCGAKRRQQQVAAAVVDTGNAIPVRVVGADDRVDRLALGRRRLRREQP